MRGRARYVSVTDRGSVNDVLVLVRTSVSDNASVKVGVSVIVRVSATARVDNVSIRVCANVCVC